MEAQEINHPLLSRFNQLRDFLQQHIQFLNKEPLLSSLDIYPQEWFDEFENKDNQFLYELDSLKTWGNVDCKSLREFIQKCQMLSQVEKYQDVTLIKKKGDVLKGINHKKIHEISVINHFVKSLPQPPKKILEIGGGKGNLSFILCLEQNISAISIDMEAEFQKLGQKRNQKYLKEKAKLISFKNQFLQEDTKIDSGDEVDMSVGLHTCGPLSKLQFDHSVYSGVHQILNFGCCYYLMELRHFNISKAAQSNPLPINIEALSLANRAHGTTPNARDGFENKLKVKRYRYSFQLLHRKATLSHKAFDLKSDPKLYKADFCVYARDSFGKLGLVCPYSNQELQTFFDSGEVQAQVNKILYANTIRAFLGKPLEMLLLLDRCLYLQDHGYQPQLIQFFDPNESPRAIGIFATR